MTTTFANGQTVGYTYDEDSILVGTYNYLWDNTKLVGVQVTEYEADENNNPAETKSIISRIIYDSDGEPLGYLLEDSVPYLYTKNILGDITGIVDGETGKLMLEYVYDAYGNMSIKTPNNSLDEAIAAIFVLMYNPLTYRGYTFAPALGYNYYLGSRFYIPQLCRFMNADIYADTTQGVIGTNMFAYCGNNPIAFSDPSGEAFLGKTATKVAGVAIPIFSVTVLAAFVVALVPIFSGGTITVSLSDAMRKTKLYLDLLPITIATSIVSALIASRIPEKLKDGDKVKTPDTHPDEFSKKGNFYKHNKTKWIFEKSKDGHYGGKNSHWHARPENGKYNDYYNIRLDGTIL